MGTGEVCWSDNTNILKWFGHGVWGESIKEDLPKAYTKLVDQMGMNFQ